MIYCLLPLLILSADAPVHTATPQTLAQEVRHWDFEAGDDKNYDRWPDDWTRRRGKGYPLYVNVEIAKDDQARVGGQQDGPGDNHALRMDLDGGAALVYSPLIEVTPMFSYVLHGSIKTEGLTHDVAYAAVMFYNKDRKLLETLKSPPPKQSGKWTKFQIDPATPSSDQTRWAAIALHLEPTAKADLTGSAMFDDLWFAKVPRVSVETNASNNLFTRPSDVEITCQVSGIPQPDPIVRFELQDIYGESLAIHEMEMQTDRPNSPSARVFAGSVTWHPPIKEFGFYRVHVSMSDQNSDPITTSIAVLQPFPKSEQGEFGWTLPRGDNPVSLKDLVSLLEQAGIHWVKFPVWDVGEDSGRADDQAWFSDRMSVRKINMIGMFDQPPRSVLESFGKREKLAVASVFGEPEVWRSAVDPVLSRLSPKFRYWQLGGDSDTSFANFRDLEARFVEIREGFDRFGQQVYIGISWRITDELPVSQDSPLSFVSLDASPSLTAEEISQYMSAEPPTGVKRWLIMKPLAKSHYSLETRARDLVSRMIAAKIQQADAVFVPDPFDDEHGLMRRRRRAG